jgi:hypothetical protein
VHRDFLITLYNKLSGMHKFHKIRPSDCYVTDMTKKELPHVCSAFAGQSERFPVWQFPMQCCRTAVSSVTVSGVTSQIKFWAHIPHFYHIWIVTVGVVKIPLFWWRQWIYTRAFHVWFYVSDAVKIRTSILWDFTERWLVIACRCFGTTYRVPSSSVK